MSYTLFYDNPLTYDNPDTYVGAPPLYFFTPTVQDEPPFLADSTPTQVGLWRHYAPGIRGVTVFLLNNGTYVQDTATGAVTPTSGTTYTSGLTYDNPLPYSGASPTLGGPAHIDVNIPYPINFNYPGAPIVQTTNWDGTVIDTNIDPYVVKQYFGGTYNGPLSTEEIASLTAAGYGPNLVPLP